MADAKESLLPPGGSVNAGEIVAGSSSRPVTAWRWWILGVYSLMACLQGAQWSLPGSLQPTYEAVFGIDGNAIQLLLNYGPFGWFAVCVPLSWHMDRHGCRASVIGSAALVFVSALLRVFARDASLTSVVLVHVSFLLNAFAGPVAMAAPAALSEAFFPVAERTTATAVMAEANNCAGVLLWLLVPVLAANEDLAAAKNVDYVFLALSAVAFVGSLIYFPSHPRHAPSASAVVLAEAQSKFTPKALWASLVTLTLNRQYAALALGYAVIAGMANTLSSLLVAILGNIGYDQTAAGWIGFASSLLGAVLGVALAKWTDRMRNQRTVLIALLTVSAATYGVFAVAAQGWLPAAITAPGSVAGYFIVGASFTACNVAFDAGIPLFFDLAAECTYPAVPEATVIMYMTTLMNAATALALAAPADSVGTTWMPWAMTAVTALGAVALAAVLKKDAPRYEYDLAHEGDGKAVSGDDAGDVIAPE